MKTVLLACILREEAFKVKLTKCKQNLNVLLDKNANQTRPRKTRFTVR